MNIYRYIGLVLGFILCASAQARNENNFDLLNIDSSPKVLTKNYGINIGHLNQLLLSKSARPPVLLASEPSLSDYETFLPHTTQLNLPIIERVLVTAYLENSKDVNLTKLLALYHLDKSLVFPNRKDGKSFKHSVIALYFLNRAQDLGARDFWIKSLLSQLDKKVSAINKKYSSVDHSENHDAQIFFNETFFYREENRYIAAEQLLDNYVEHSNNVYTSFLNTALNLWVGSEADYADASMLYNFILGSYFSARTIELAYKAEMSWSQDPENNQRFRLASILGGFSALERKSLAIIHDDQAAIEKIDNEHREWRLINPAFHSFTVGLSFFKEPENFLEGYMAWEGALSSCEERPELITCLNRPRYTFNSLGIFVGRADFALKSGDIASAQTYLFITQFLENFAFWDLGRDAITHRQINADAIAALYLNDDPSDDPSHFNMKKHKWGGDTSTCQTCHQTQSRVWSQEEQDNVLVAPDDMLTVGDWPEFSTTWYGALKTR